MIRKIKTTIFLILINCNLLGCVTSEIGTNEQGQIAGISFYVQNRSNLVIKNTDIIYISQPTFTCNDNINSASVLCPKINQLLEKIKPNIEKKFTDLGYNVSSASNKNQASLSVSLNINLYIRNYTDYIPDTSAFDKDPYTKLTAIENGYCGNPPVSLKEAYQILNDPQRSNCNSHAVNAYEYNYSYTLSIFQKNNPSTPIYQSKVKPFLINDFTLYELINKMIDSTFATFPMNGNVIVKFAGLYPKLEPIEITFNSDRKKIE